MSDQYRKFHHRAWMSLMMMTLCAVLHSVLPVPAFADDRHWKTASPINYVVVLFQENVSFDHYFATYPEAANPAGEPAFQSAKTTPAANGIPPSLMTSNPNASAPFRLDRSLVATCDQDHDYTAEQEAYHSGLLNQFVQVAIANPSGCDPGQVMGYFDGNTITALWNYAQHFAMSDNHFSTTYGPSTPGALNLVSGQTHGVDSTVGDPADGDVETGSVIGDPQPFYDDCSTRDTVGMSGNNKNIGDLLNAQGITWGFFQGGFNPSSVDSKGKAVCGTAHLGSDGVSKKDYIPHHEPFQYYASTANPHHLPPSAVAFIGRQDQANHQYDLSSFWSAVSANNMPAVSFLKAAGYQDGHAGYSDPLAEQGFLVNTINRLQSLPEWKEMLIIIAYDDSDGWYDHVMPPVVKQSATSSDALTGAGACGKPESAAYPGRCGYGPRQPLLVISPYARKNYIDHSITDLTSILRFIEDNWNLGRIGDQSFDAVAGTLDHMLDFRNVRSEVKLILDPLTGHPVEP